MHVFVADDLIHNDFGDRAVFVEKIDQRIAYSRHHRTADVSVAKFVFGLGFKNRFTHFYGDGSDQSVADVISLVVPAGKFVDAFQYSLFESG